MKKMILFLGVASVMLVVLIQCVSVPKRWPTYERRADDRMVVIQQRIGKGLEVGELTPNEGQILLARLENIRKDYTVLRERSSTQEEWESLLARVDDLEREVNRQLAYPSRVDEIRIEDRMIILQRKIDEGRMTGRFTRMQAREFQARLDAIRGEFFHLVKDRPFTQEEKIEVARRLDLLEGDINRGL